MWWRIARFLDFEKTGHPIHKTSIYRLLKRHNGRKITPRPKHPKSKEEQQEKFKKEFYLLLKEKE